jgi:hypothetical protein
VFNRARRRFGLWREPVTPAPVPDLTVVPASSLGVASVATFRAGCDVTDVSLAHALPVVRSTPARVSVLIRPVCGARLAAGLRLAGDWRELPANRQCPSCHRFVAA